jgi:hypothetical protein
MIGVAHHWEPRMTIVTSALRSLLKMMREGIESYGEYRAERAVSAAQWRNADDEIRRYRRLIHADR